MQGTSKKRKILLTFAAVAAVGTVAILGTLAAFTATTSNTGNSISSGTVALSDSDGDTGKVYNLSGTTPGSTSTAKCLRVTYSGSLAATVKVYRTAITAGTGDDYTLRIERGSGLSGPASDMNCTGFSPAADVHNADLGNLGTDYTGGTDAKGSAWSSGNTVDYRFTITTKDDSTANAHTSDNATGSHDFVFEAHNN